MQSIWENASTINGLNVETVVSGFQKQVRRNMPEEACRLAYELYISSPTLLDKLWSRILAISVEDIGFGNLNAPQQVYVLNQMRKEYPYSDPDQPMFFIHAIRILCESEKDRSSDYLKNIVIKTSEFGQLPEIPDVAYDKHTKIGREMGRDSFHFFHEGAKVIPEMKVDNDYKKRYEEILEDYYKNNKECKGYRFKYTSTY